MAIDIRGADTPKLSTMTAVLDLAGLGMVLVAVALLWGWAAVLLVVGLLTLGTGIALDVRENR